MKFIPILALILLTGIRGFAQQVFVDPSSVSLTKPGVVTIIDTDLKGSSDGGSSATVGTLTATYSNYVSGYAANQGFNYLGFSAAATGTLSAGTYAVTTHNNPKQVTVILWNESSDGGFTINDVELAYDSASAADQALFQSFIASLVQQQLTNLQNQIDSQQSQISILQQSDTDQSAAIAQLQKQVGELINSYNQLAEQNTAVQDRLEALEAQLASISVTNGANGSDGKNGKSANNTWGYIGAGLGAAGVITAILNFSSQSNHAEDEPPCRGSFDGSDK